MLTGYDFDWRQAGLRYRHALSLRPGYVTLEYAVTLAGPVSMWTAELIYGWARAGDGSGATRLLSELLERGRRERVSPYDLAIAFAGIGDHVSALDHLEQVFNEREMRLTCLGDPEFDGLRGDRRYRRVLDRLRLPGAPI